MFKYQSTERPSTPKLGSVALPEAHAPRRHTVSSGKPTYSEKPFKPSLVGRFPSSSPEGEVPRTHRISLSEGSRYKAQVASYPLVEEEDEVLFKPSKKLTHVPTQVSKQELEEKAAQKQRDIDAYAEEVKQMKRRVGAHRISTVKSKAAKEEEMERWEEEERQREQRELDEQKKAAQRQLSAMQAAPRKSCLKGSSPPQTSSATPSPNSQYEFPTTVFRPDLMRRRESSANYYSDTEQIRQVRTAARRSNTYHAQPTQHTIASSYPPDPSIHQYAAGAYDTRQRNQSIVNGRQPGYTLTPGHTPKYMKAYIKEGEKRTEGPPPRPFSSQLPVRLKDEAIALSWPLVDFEVRRHTRTPALFFDAAFDPRVRGYEIQVIRYGEGGRSPMAREEERMPVSPHAFMTEMTLICDKLSRWPVVVHSPTGIRVIDVFRAIFDTYSIVLTKAELMHFGRERIDRCQRAFEQRCNDGPQLPPVTMAKGICRIDLLRGEKIFKGLTPLSGPQYPPNCWQLHFESITRGS